MIDMKKWVVFAILMENNDGILGKHPNYISEKLNMCQSLEHPERLLDESNLAKYKAWCNLWI